MISPDQPFYGSGNHNPPGRSGQRDKRAQLTEKLLEYYKPSDIKPNQEILVKSRYRMKIRLPALMKTLIALGAQVGIETSEVLGVQNTPLSALFTAGGAGGGALLYESFKTGRINVVNDEIDLTLLESVSGLSFSGGNPISVVDGGTGITYKYHSNKKSCGDITLRFYRERDHEEYQRTITLFHLFINYGLKCDAIIEKYALDKTKLCEFLLQGVGFYNINYEPLEKSAGGPWMYQVTASVDFWQERFVYEK